MNTAFLLAAGHGTRLRPLTLLRPKPLVPICGLPMLDYAMAELRAHGHTQVLANAHHLWEQVAGWCEQNGAELQVELPEILGTGGGLRAAADRLAERFVVVNGDILSDVDLGALLAAVPDGGAAMALRALQPEERITPVLADEAGVVRQIGTIVDTPGGLPGTHFTGIHAMHRDALALVPEAGLQCVVRTAYKQIVSEGRVGSIAHRGTWVDVGTPTAYLAANLGVLRGEIATSLDPWAHGKRGPGGSWLGAAATVEGTVEHAVIGPRAHVPSGATLRRCVVWDGVSVPPGEHADTIFYDEGAALTP